MLVIATPWLGGTARTHSFQGFEHGPPTWGEQYTTELTMYQGFEWLCTDRWLDLRRMELETDTPLLFRPLLERFPLQYEDDESEVWSIKCPHVYGKEIYYVNAFLNALFFLFAFKRWKFHILSKIKGINQMWSLHFKLTKVHLRRVILQTLCAY